MYPGTVLSGIDTNFPQVDLSAAPGGSVAFDLNSPAKTAFPGSGVSLIQQCNTVFTGNFNNGGSFISSRKLLARAERTVQLYLLARL
jgi:hypothetical protein